MCPDCGIGLELGSRLRRQVFKNLVLLYGARKAGITFWGSDLRAGSGLAR